MAGFYGEQLPPTTFRSGRAKVSVSIVAGWIALTFYMVCSVVYHPVHIYSMFLVTWLCGLPVSIAAAYGLSRICPRPSINFYSNGKIVSRVIGSVMLSLATPGLVFLLNAKLDRGPESDIILPVLTKHINHGRHSTSYYGMVESPPDLGFTLFGDRREQVRLSGFKQYQALQVGIDQARLVTKPGFFGMPWIVSLETVNSSNFGMPDSAPGAAAYRKALNSLNGTGVPKDEAMAAALFRQSADLGYPMAQHDLGSMYSYGTGVPRDDQAAALWVGKAAAQGLPIAQGDLGVLYGDGHGVPQDWVQSYMWLTLAAQGGMAQAQKDLSFAASHMTPAQINDAKQRALAFVPRQEVH